MYIHVVQCNTIQTGACIAWRVITLIMQTRLFAENQANLSIEAHVCLEILAVDMI